MYRISRILLAVIAAGAIPFFASAASLVLDPSTGTYGPGDTFIVNVRLNTDSSQCINAAHVIIDYPTQTLRAVDFGRGNSIFSLWIADPQIDTGAGSIDFSGGVPGGYCGRIPGDPALSNILGTIVFSVIGTSSRSASIQFSHDSLLYQNDGLGTAVIPTFGNTTISIARTAMQATNPWIAQVSSDTIPPEPFVITLASTREVFNGKYYIVFSTVDKQSGLDHYEIYENGTWNRVTSPHILADQSLRSLIEVRAIDKAGTMRMGTYTQNTPPPRQYSLGDLFISLMVLLALIVSLASAMYIHHRRHRSTVLELHS